MAKVVVLNGVGSVGKSSTARALQDICAEPLMHVSMDAFLSMMPDRLFGTPDGLVFETIQRDGSPAIVIHTGPVVERGLRGMRHAVAALANHGNSLVVDEVMWGDEAAHYRELLAGHDLRFVGLHAPLDVLEAREKARGDREIGLARWQYDRVHGGIGYDLELDTTAGTPLEMAQQIRDAFGL